MGGDVYWVKARLRVTVLFNMIIVTGNIYKYHLDGDKSTKGPTDVINGSGY